MKWNASAPITIYVMTCSKVLRNVNPTKTRKKLLLVDVIICFVICDVCNAADPKLSHSHRRLTHGCNDDNLVS